MNVALGYRKAKVITQRHAKSFSFASIALRGERRDAAFALYAFCRGLDDLVDEHPTASITRLTPARALIGAVWHAKEAIPDHAAAVGFDVDACAALSDAVTRFGIPEQPMQDLVSGMEMDLTRDRYDRWAELELYCYRVAGTVGILLSSVLGVSDERALPHAADLGRAMQLTNILRDVREDLERGRIYLPQDELRAFGVDDAALRRGELSDGFMEMMRFQISRAREFYASAADGIPHLQSGQLMVRLMGEVYGRILHAIERRGFDVFSGRAHVPTGEKLLIAVRTAFGAANVLRSPPPLAAGMVQP